jgi:PTS system nitrogen regulatory IIA component
MLAPEAANEQHLQVLSELAEMFSARALREMLATAPDAAHSIPCLPTGVLP